MAALVQSFFDQVHAGEFNLLHFSISLARPWTGQLPDRSREERKLRMADWMAYTSLYHEYRHYHDLAGTSCGLHTMLRVTDLVDRFLEHAFTSRETLRAPIRKCDPESDFLRIYDGYQRLLRVICGDLPIGPDPDDSGLVIRDVSTLGGTFKVPHLTMTDIDPFTGAPRDRLVPIGLRALIEATAIETQIFLSVVGSGPLEAADEQETIERGLHIAEAWGGIVRGGNLIPYAVCEFLFHYWTGDYPELGLLTAFSEAALMYSGYSEAAFPNDPATFDPPGIVFTNLAAAHARLRTDGTQLQQVAAAAAHIGMPPYEQVIQQMAERLSTDASCVAPPALRPHAARTEHVSLIRQYLFRDFAKVIKRKASAPIDSMLAPLYLKMYPDLPMPPMVSIATSIANTRDKEELVHWIEWIFLLAMISDLVEKPRLDCPVRDRMPALGAIFSFPDPARPGAETSCTRFIEQKCCGTYNGEFLAGQPPQCHFVTNIKQVMGRFGFKDVEFLKEERPS